MTVEDIIQRLQPPTAAKAARRGRRTVVVSAIRLAEARGLVEAGKSRDALEVLREFGELKDFGGTDARLLAGEIAENLGAPRLSRYLHLRAWRAAPNAPESQAAGLYALWQCRGVYLAWRRSRILQFPPGKKNVSGVTKVILLRAQKAGGFLGF